MKNIYNLNASQVNQDGFQFRIIYRDDRTGVDNPSLHEGTNTRDVPLIELLELDRLGPALDPPKDGNFEVSITSINEDRGNRDRIVRLLPREEENDDTSKMSGTRGILSPDRSLGAPGVRGAALCV